MSNKKSKLITLLVIVFGIALTYLVITLVMDMAGKINQGSCRFIDIVTTSNIEVEDNSEQMESLPEVNELKLSISQKNKIDMILAPSSNISEIYIDNLYISNPAKIGKMVFYQMDDKTNQHENGNYIVETKTKDNECIISINIDNEHFLDEVSVPEGKSYLKFDGTILNDYEIPLENVAFTVKFNLNVIDNSGKKSTCKMEFEFPTQKFINEGIDITRKSLEEFNFKVN